MLWFVTALLTSNTRALDPHCQDTANWSDSEGRTCTAYTAACRMNGGWQELLKVHSVPNVFEAHRSRDSGLSALDACCMCGKGEARETLSHALGYCVWCILVRPDACMHVSKLSLRADAGTKEALASIFGHGKIGGGTVVVKGRKLRGMHTSS